MNKEEGRKMSEHQLQDKGYVTEDYRKKEADIVYRMKIRQGDLQEQEVIFYVLLELQSSVDNLMPLRLLNYMTRIWLQETKKKVKDKRQPQDYRQLFPLFCIMDNPVGMFQ